MEELEPSLCGFNMKKPSPVRPWNPWKPFPGSGGYLATHEKTWRDLFRTRPLMGAKPKTLDELISKPKEVDSKGIYFLKRTSIVKKNLLNKQKDFHICDLGDVSLGEPGSSKGMSSVSCFFLNKWIRFKGESFSGVEEINLRTKKQKKEVLNAVGLSASKFMKSTNRRYPAGWKKGRFCRGRGKDRT